MRDWILCPKLCHSGFNEAAQCENTVRFSFRADTPVGQPRKVKVMTFLARVKAPSQVAKNYFAGNLVYYIMIYSSNKLHLTYKANSCRYQILLTDSVFFLVPGKHDAIVPCHSKKDISRQIVAQLIQAAFQVLSGPSFVRLKLISDHDRFCLMKVRHFHRCRCCHPECDWLQRGYVG